MTIKGLPYHMKRLPYLLKQMAGSPFSSENTGTRKRTENGYLRARYNLKGPIMCEESALHKDLTAD